MTLDEELLTALVDLLEVTRRVVEQVEEELQSNAPVADSLTLDQSFGGLRAGRSIRVKQTDMLDFDGGFEPVVVSQLLRIIVNASRNAARVADYLRDMGKPTSERRNPVPFSAAMRYAASLRDSLSALGRMLGSDHYFVARTPEWRPPDDDDDEPEEKPEKPEEPEEPKEPKQEPLPLPIFYYSYGNAAQATKLAEIYRQIKHVHDNVNAVEPDQVIAMLRNVMVNMSSEGGA